jgi:hypothetical protein
MAMGIFETKGALGVPAEPGLLLSVNLARLGRRWPKVADEIDAAEAPEAELVEGESAGCSGFTARVRGLQLTSAYDRLVEAHLMAERIPSGSREATVYGLGLGDLVRDVLARHELEVVRLVLFDPGLVKLGLALGGDADWLDDPRIELAWARDEAGLCTPFAVVPPALQLAEDRALALRDAVGAKLQAGFAADHWQERLVVIEGHIRSNEVLVAADGDVGSVFGRSPGGRAVVVGPGPTLVEHLEELRDFAAGAELVVISTALEPVLAAGLVPDFVVMIDSHSIVPFTSERAAALAHVPLVYVPDVQRSTLEAWPGPRLVGYLRRPRFAALAARYPRAELWTAGTVAHSAVDLAVKLGAADVALFGLDFSYPGGVSHSPGTPDYEARRGADQGRTLVNGLGVRVPSDPNLIAYLRDLEAFVRQNPSVSFTRAGRDAATVEGVSWITP